MKLNKILLSATVLLGGLTAAAQEQVTEEVFNPHFYGEAQFGAQETLGEGAFNILAGPNAQLAAGYQFSPVFGLRLSVNSWRSRATEEIGAKRYKWQWSYVAPSVEGMFNLTNLFGGYNPGRLVDVNAFAGIGVNVAFKNDEAAVANDGILSTLDPEAQKYFSAPALGHLWDGTKTRLTGRLGFDVYFNVSSRVALGLEANANFLNDHYNSKKAGNADWYFNTLVGVKYAFGPRTKKVTKIIEKQPCDPVIVEKIVEKLVEVPVQIEEEKKNAVAIVSSLRRDVFFKINNTVVAPDEMGKVAAIADYLNSHPDARVTITGYADKGTGTKAINLRLAAKRAETVANCLKKDYGIASSRITVKSMGDLEDQPYPDPVQNRVAICIAQ